MMLYYRAKLKNSLLAKQLFRWRKINLTTNEEYTHALQGLEPRYKTTNVFLRIGIFLLTFVIAVCSLGLMALFFSDILNNQYIAAFLLMAISVVIYIVLKNVVKDRSWHANGADDCISYMIILGMITSLVLFVPPGKWSNTLFCFSSFAVLLIATVLFADVLIAACFYVAGAGLIFYVSVSASPYANLFLPFLLMAVAATVYYFSGKMLNDYSKIIYHSCLDVLQIMSLILFYLAGNYYIIHEAGKLFFQSEHTPMAWLFWIFTVSVPLVYIVIGLKSYDRTFLNMGLILSIAAVLTIRNYYSVLPVEIALIIGGILLLAIAWAALKYLKNPAKGFTKEKDESEEFLIHPDLEAFIVSQTLTPHAPVKEEHKTIFGGGLFGGGGAGGEV